MDLLSVYKVVAVYPANECTVLKRHKIQIPLCFTSVGLSTACVGPLSMYCHGTPVPLFLVISSIS